MPPAFGIKSASSRTLDRLRRGTASAFQFELMPSRGPKVLYSGSSDNGPVAQPSDFAIGSDKSVGGLSTAELTSVPASSSSDADQHQASSSHLAFHGIMSLRMPPLLAGRVRPGFASFRNGKRSSLFGEEYWDLQHHTHLRVVVAYRGWEGWRRRWVCTFQTDGPIETDLFQHRLDLGLSTSLTSSQAELDPLSPSDLHFSTLYLPLDGFVLTNHGRPAFNQIAPMLEKVRSVGFSLLGGGRAEEILPTIRPGALDLIKRTQARNSGTSKQSAGSRQTKSEIEEEDEDEFEISPSIDPKQPLSRFQNQLSGALSSGSTAAASLQPREGTEAYYELCIKSVEAVYYDSNEMQVQEDQTVQPSDNLI